MSDEILNDENMKAVVDEALRVIRPALEAAYMQGRKDGINHTIDKIRERTRAEMPGTAEEKTK